MTGPQADPSRFPQGLLDWAGHRSGGVRRLFDQGSGRPSGDLVRTNLVRRLSAWVDDLVDDKPDTPRMVLLLGGPGNGKTEAVEFTVGYLDERLGLEGKLLSKVIPQFAGGGRPIPRVAEVDLSSISGSAKDFVLQIVQDASAADSARTNVTRAELLISELEAATNPVTRSVYIACVNRGILDDALIASIELGRDAVHALLEDTVRSVSLSPNAPSCWPLEGHPKVAVWPMDVESLFIESDSQEPSPARELLERATRESSWPAFGSCSAGEHCPFCLSRQQLSSAPQRTSLLGILRWFELATGKRWSFRDLFSLLSYLLAGVQAREGRVIESPCDWAARTSKLRNENPTRPDAEWYRAPFALVAAQYQHALFGSWDRAIAKDLREDLKKLDLIEDATLLGLYHFLNMHGSLSVPGTLGPQLASIDEVLDPALADPDEEVEVSSRTTLSLRDIDARFSQSVRAGLDSVRRYRCLTQLEIELLTALASADERLGSSDVRRKRPATASKVQAIVRDFSCRLVRRSLGVRSRVVRDAATLRDFEKIMDGDAALLHRAVKEVAGLLNEQDRWFVVALNTTFGEPLPPKPQRAILRTDRQKVRPGKHNAVGRPAPTIRFLEVGSSAQQMVPLTFELFRSVRELSRGMLVSSLPRPVVALLDTTRARLAGRIVRDEDSLEQAELRIGTRNEVIVRELGKFIVRAGDPE